MGKAGDAYLRSISKQGQATRDVNRSLEDMRKRYVQVVREMNEIQKTGGNQSAYAKLSEEAKALSAEMQKMRGAKQDLGGVGSGFENIAQSARQAGQSIVGMISGGAWGFLKKLAAGAKNAAIALAKLAGRAVVSGLRKIGQYAGQAAKKIFGLGRSARQSGNGFGFSLKNLLKYGLGIRSLFVLFNRLRNAIKDGFETMSKYNPALKSALTSLSASLNGLKGSLATAFAPILTAIAPALTTLINLLTQAVNAIGMFFAALTGQAFYAAKGIASVGSAAGKASGSAKELKRQLAGFDELNILSANSGGGGGGGGGGAGGGFTYQQMPISEGIQNFVNEVKRLFAAGEYEEIGHVIADGINKAIAKAKDFIKWANIGPTITKYINVVTGTLNGLFGRVDFREIGSTLASGLNTVTNALRVWYITIRWRKIGEDIGDAINGFFADVDWDGLGQLVYDKGKAVIDMLVGAVTTIEWGSAGTDLARAFNAFFRDDKLWRGAGFAIDMALKGLLDFTKNFIIKFDAIQAAKDIRAALAQIKWKEIASDFWDTAKLAFNKAGSFIKVLMGGSVYDVQGNAVDQMWERGSGGASSKAYTTSWISRFVAKIGDILADIPWTKILGEVKTAFLTAFDDLLDGLFNSENGDIVLRIMAAVAGLKITPKVIASLFGGGSAASGVGAAGGVGGLFAGSGGIMGGLALTGIAGLLTGDYVYNNYMKETTQKIAKQAAPFITDWVKSHELTGQHAGSGNAGADLIAWLVGGTDAVDNLEEAVKKNTKEVKKSNDKAGSPYDDPFSKESQLAMVFNGFDVAGWDEIYNGTWEVDVGVDYTPDGANGSSFVNRPLEWLANALKPGAILDVKSRLTGKTGDSKTPSGIYGTFIQLAAKLTGKSADSKTPSGIYGTVLQLGAKLTGKTKDSKTAAIIYGTVTNFLAKMTGKDKNSKTASDVFGTVANFVSNLTGKKSGTKGVTDIYGSIATFIANLTNRGSNWQDGLLKWMTGNKNGNVTITISVSGGVQRLGNDIAKAFKKSAGLASGGIVTAGGRVLPFVNGGYISGAAAGFWNSIPKYAHGTLFAAGEAGPEVVGHIGGRTEVLNRSQLAQTMQSAVYSGMVAAMSRITFRMPAMAGSVMPYEVSAQIARAGEDIRQTLDENNEDLIQTIISVAAQIVAAMNSRPVQQSARSVTPQQVIDEINRRTQMFGASPLMGV